MTLYQIYEVLRIRLKGSGRAFEVDEYNAVIRMVNLRLLNQESAKLEDGQDIIESLKFLKTIADPALSIDASGNANYPNDYYRKVRISKDDYDVQVLIEDELSEVIKSPLFPPSATEPVVVFRNGEFQFYPITLVSADLIYLRYPETPVFAYKANATTGAVEYDADNSTEFEWNESKHSILLSMIYEEFGLTNNKE